MQEASQDASEATPGTASETINDEIRKVKKTIKAKCRQRILEQEAHHKKEIAKRVHQVRLEIEAEEQRIQNLPTKEWNVYHAKMIANLMESAAKRGRLDTDTKAIFDIGCERLMVCDTQLKSYIENWHDKKTFKLVDEAITYASTINGVIFYFPGCGLYLPVEEDMIGMLIQDLLNRCNVNDQPITKQVVPVDVLHKLVLLCRKDVKDGVLRKLQQKFDLEKGAVHVHESDVDILSVPIMGTHQENVKQYEQLMISMNNSGEYNGGMRIGDPKDGYLYFDVDMIHIEENTKDYKLLPAAAAALVDRLNINMNVNNDNSMKNCHNTHSFNGTYNGNIDSNIASPTVADMKMNYVRSFINTNNPEGIKTGEYEKMYRASLGDECGVRNDAFKQAIVDAGYVQTKIDGSRIFVWRKKQ